MASSVSVDRTGEKDTFGWSGFRNYKVVAVGIRGVVLISRTEERVPSKGKAQETCGNGLEVA